jgi:hypothetical protein
MEQATPARNDCGPKRDVRLDWSRLRRSVSDPLLVATLVCTAATAVIVLVTHLHFAYLQPGLHVALETAAALIGLLAGYLVSAAFVAAANSGISRSRTRSACWHSPTSSWINLARSVLLQTSSTSKAGLRRLGFLDSSKRWWLCSRGSPCLRKNP